MYTLVASGVVVLEHVAAAFFQFFIQVIVADGVTNKGSAVNSLISMNSPTFCLACDTSKIWAVLSNMTPDFAATIPYFSSAMKFPSLTVVLGVMQSSPECHMSFYLLAHPISYRSFS